MSETETTTITAGEILDALTASGIVAEVQQSGGGCATIYVGPTRVDEHGDTRHACLIGPGSYHWTAPNLSTFYPGDLFVGPDDDGDTSPMELTTIDEIVAGVRRTLGYPTIPTAAEAAERLSVGLSDRERMLAAEALERLDPDTLNDDLLPSEQTTGAELDAVAARFKTTPTDDEGEIGDAEADRLAEAVDTMSEIIEACAAAGFTPTDDLDTLPQWVAHWAACRHQGETIAVVDWTEEVITVEHRTSSTGIRLTRATFTTDRIGLRLFAECAALWP